VVLLVAVRLSGHDWFVALVYENHGDMNSSKNRLRRQRSPEEIKNLHILIGGRPQQPPSLN
jgi:hypothetical protein